MEENQFDLGEALGSYEQAQADRNFYLSMVQQGQQNRGAFMASPIAAYLAGVAGVKMANQRAKVQNIEDARQAKMDATAAAEKAQKRQADLVNQLTSIAKGVSEGTIPASVGATLVGPIGNELGIRVKQYIPEEGKIVYNEGNDPTDFEWDWRENPSVKEKGLQSRAEQRMAWEKEKQQAGIAGQIKVAQEKANIKKASGGDKQQFTSLAGFKTAHEKVLKAVGKAPLAKMLTYGQVKDFVEGVEGLDEADRKQMEGKVNEILSTVQELHPDWPFATTMDQPGYVASPKSILDKYKQ